MKTLTILGKEEEKPKVIYETRNKMKTNHTQSMKETSQLTSYTQYSIKSNKEDK